MELNSEENRNFVSLYKTQTREAAKKKSVQHRRDSLWLAGGFLAVMSVGFLGMDKWGDSNAESQAREVEQNFGKNKIELVTFAESASVEQLDAYIDDAEHAVTNFKTGKAAADVVVNIWTGAKRDAFYENDYKLDSTKVMLGFYEAAKAYKAEAPDAFEQKGKLATRHLLNFAQNLMPGYHEIDPALKASADRLEIRL
jgi:hypothetical protein